MKLMMRALAAVCLLSILLILIGCGGGSSPSGGGTPPPPTSAQCLFATSNATVLTFSMDTSSGALTLKANGPSAPGNFGIAASPSASFLYTSDAMTGGVAGFSISSSGTLTAVSGSPFPLPNDPPGSTFPPVDSLAMHPSAKFLFAPDSPASGVVGFVIDSTTGALSVVPGSPFATEAGPEQVAIDPPGRFLYVSDLSGPGISGFDINATTGVLTPITGSPFSSEESPDGLVVHSSGKFIYSALTYDNSIQALAIDQTTGALTEIHGSPFLLPPVEGFQANPYSIAQDPAGKFLYALASSNGRIYEFRLTPVPAS